MTTDELNEEAVLFLATGKRYYEAAHKAGISGAIIWVKDTDGFGCLYTRGEYCSRIIANIEGQGPTKYFGAMKDE